MISNIFSKNSISPRFSKVLAFGADAVILLSFITLCYLYLHFPFHSYIIRLLFFFSLDQFCPRLVYFVTFSKERVFCFCIFVFNFIVIKVIHEYLYIFSSINTFTELTLLGFFKQCLKLNSYLIYLITFLLASSLL